MSSRLPADERVTITLGPVIGGAPDAMQAQAVDERGTILLTLYGPGWLVAWALRRWIASTGQPPGGRV